MKNWNTALLLGATIGLAGCVTINVYFPAAAAEKAAEKFVGDVLAEPQDDGSLFDPWRSPGEVVRKNTGKSMNDSTMTRKKRRNGTTSRRYTNMGR